MYNGNADFLVGNKHDRGKSRGVGEYVILRVLRSFSPHTADQHATSAASSSNPCRTRRSQIRAGEIEPDHLCTHVDVWLLGLSVSSPSMRRVRPPQRGGPSHLAEDLWYSYDNVRQPPLLQRKCARSQLFHRPLRGRAPTYALLRRLLIRLRQIRARPPGIPSPSPGQLATSNRLHLDLKPQLRLRDEPLCVR